MPMNNKNNYGPKNKAKPMGKPVRKPRGRG